LHFAPIVEAINTDAERSFVVIAGCSAVLGGNYSISFAGYPGAVGRCERIHSDALKILKDDAAVDEVIVTSNWLDLPERIGNGDAKGGLAAMRSELTGIVTEAAAPGREFFLIGTMPEIPRTVVECAHSNSSSLLRAPCIATVRSSNAVAVREKSFPTDNLFGELSKSLPTVIAVIPTERLCTADECEVYLDGEFLYLDIGHIRRNLRMQTRKDFAGRIGLTAALSARPKARLGARMP
jgi:hypothetical protein